MVHVQPLRIVIEHADLSDEEMARVYIEIPFGSLSFRALEQDRPDLDVERSGLFRSDTSHCCYI